MLSDGVTVLMPVYNGQEFLAGQIESILMQDYTPLRLHIIDDGSTDGSLQIARHYQAGDPRVEISRNPQNLGFIPTIGSLLRNVTTQYFALADQDDIWDLDKLSRSISMLKQSGAELVYSDVRLCDELGRITQTSYLDSARIRVVSGRDPLPFVFRNPAIGHTIVSTARVAALASAIPEQLIYHEAWIVGVACTFGDVVCVGAQLGTYRVHSQNVVGPRRQHKLVRLASLMRSRHRLARRELIRSRALSALSDMHPELRRIAPLYERHGTARLRAGLPFVRFLLAYQDQIGLAPVLSESCLFLLGGILRNPSPPASESKLTEC